MNKITKFFLIVGILALLGLMIFQMAKAQKMVVVKTDNIECKPINIELGKYQDSDCGMVIESLQFASQVCDKTGKTWFFHDHGGMARWLQDKDFKKDAKIWVWAKDSKKWVEAKSAFFSRNDLTPMNYGFGAYEQKKDGFVDFDKVGELMLAGENLNNPHTAKELGMK